MWINLAADTRRFIESCITCKKHKLEPRNFRGFKLPVSKKKMSLVYGDLFGFNALSSVEGKEGILVLIEAVTCFTLFIPISGRKAKDLKKAFVREWVSLFGFPTALYFDNEPGVGSAEFSQFLELNGTRAFFSTPYDHSQNVLQRCA